MAKIGELKKIREWLYDYYSMFDEEHSAMLIIKRVGEREVGSFAEAHAHVMTAFDLHIMWASGIRPAPLNEITKVL